jgi:cytoskeletal protein RodZ
MRFNFGRHFASIVLVLMVIGLMAPAALRAQSGQTPSSSGSSNAQSNSQSTGSTTSTKKSKKSKSTSDAGGTSGSTAGGGTSGSTASSAKSSTSASASSGAAAPSIAHSPATADTHAASNNKTSAVGSTPPSPGMVWVNTSTKVYHKQGSKYYGNTKQGKWMTEADAQKAGFKAASN